MILAILLNIIKQQGGRGSAKTKFLLRFEETFQSLDTAPGSHPDQGKCSPRQVGWFHFPAFYNLTF